MLVTDLSALPSQSCVYVQYDQGTAFPVGMNNSEVVNAYNIALTSIFESGRWVGRWDQVLDTGKAAAVVHCAHAADRDSNRRHSLVGSRCSGVSVLPQLLPSCILQL